LVVYIICIDDAPSDKHQTGATCSLSALQATFPYNWM